MRSAACLSALVIALTHPCPAHAQCDGQVTHLTGSLVVTGIDVTVTSSGVVDNNSVYCPETLPYFIGYEYGMGTSGTGSYTFTFVPPIANAVFNISGLSNDVTNHEEVWVYVNGGHYAIPVAGSPQICDPMALLTADGNIAPCTNCGVSGWGYTIVPGPIATLTIMDTVFIGNPAGSIFSLFICPNGKPTGIWEEGAPLPGPYPNPASGEFTVQLRDANSTVRLFDPIGREVAVVVKREGLLVGMDVSSLTDGIYTVEVLDGSSRTTHRLVLK